ncbi:MAG: hypothetical protein F6J97_15865 [Leptolyngbya sp. SIO4C1]|nr:hypothetical protein [Leptolyngbya sp. SIO4C1]
MLTLKIELGKNICDAHFNFDTGDRTVWMQWLIELSTAKRQLLRLKFPHPKGLN